MFSDVELIPYAVVFSLALLVILVYTNYPKEPDVGDSNIETLEKAFLNSIDSVENEIIDVTKKLTNHQSMTKVTAFNENSLGDILTAISDSNKR